MDRYLTANNHEKSNNMRNNAFRVILIFNPIK